MTKNNDTSVDIIKRAIQVRTGLVIETYGALLAGPRLQVDWFVNSNVSIPFAYRLERDGKLLGPSDQVLSHYASNYCHKNSINYSNSKRGKLIWSGFSLNDNVWRVHSWCVESGQVIECTPTAREAYFGVAINSPEAFAEVFTGI